MLYFILVLLLLGLLFGLIARAVVPGPDPMTLAETWVLGIVGSLVGGFLGYLLFGNDAQDGALQFGGIVGSIIGSILALLVYRSMKGQRAL